MPRGPNDGKTHETAMITGKTRIFGIVADPIAHVRTPEVMNELFAARHADAVMVPLHVRVEDLETVLAAVRRVRNLAGLIVTVPHKTAVTGLCDAVGEQARLVGAANAVRREDDGRLACDMFDGKGFLGGLLGEGIDPKGRKVLVIGAGGAAAAIAFALAAHGVAALAIANRTQHKARALAARVARAFPACAVTGGVPAPAGCELVVNATSLGLRPGDALPLDVDLLRPGMVAAEIIMKPARTAFVQAAEAKGCRVHLGRHMLDAQIRLLADFLVAAPCSTDSTRFKAGRRPVNRLLETTKQEGGNHER